MENWTRTSLAQTIDHTILKASATEEQIRELCVEARNYGFFSVCINPCWLPLAAKELSGSQVALCTVVGFPLGANLTKTKVEESILACSVGATEIDMVMNIGWAKAGDWSRLTEDIRAVVQATQKASRGQALVKVILEMCYLQEGEKAKACEASLKAGAAFVKTSTGFGPSGASADDVRLMRKIVGAKCKIKAAGGIRTYHDAINLLSAGAQRIGSSSSVAIVSELPE